MYQLLISTKPYGVKASDGTTAFTTLDKTYNQIDGSTAAKSLAEGSIAVFNENEALLITGGSGGADVKDQDNVRFAVGMGANKAIQFGARIKRSGIKRISYQPYIAPVKQVTVVGSEKVSSPYGLYNLGAGSSLIPAGADVTGYSAIITVTEVNTDFHIVPFGLQEQIYEIQIPYWITTDDTTYTAAYVQDWITDQFITKINNNPRSLVVASGVDNSGSNIGLVLTAKDYDLSFTVGVSGVLAYSSIVNPDFEIRKGNTSTLTTTDCKVGQGRPKQILKLEQKSWAYAQGYSDRAILPDWQTWKQTSQVNTGAGCGYELLTIEYDLAHPGIGEMLRAADTNAVLQIAIEGTLGGGVETGAWTISNSSDVKTKLDALLPIIFGAGRITVTSAVEPADDIA